MLLALKGQRQDISGTTLLARLQITLIVVVVVHSSHCTLVSYIDMGKQIVACHVVVGVISWESGKVTSVDFASFYLVIPLRIYFSPWGQGVDSNQRVT